MDDVFSENLYGDNVDESYINGPEKLPNINKDTFDVNFQHNQKATSQQILPSTLNMNTKKSNILNNSVNSTNKVEIYNKVLNNIKKVYNIQKQVLYATELEKEKLIEDSKKRVIPVKEMLKGSLYGLDSEQISKIIFKERRRLDVKRFKRLLKRRKEDKANELKELQEQLKSKLYDDEPEDIEKENDADYFMTQVEKTDEEDNEINGEDEENQEKSEIAVSDENEEDFENYLKPACFKEEQILKKPFFAMKDDKKGFTTSSSYLQRKYTNRFNTKALLQIDSRWNSVPKYGEPLDDKEHLKRIYNFDGAMKGIRKQFIPSMRIKRHPQLEKIEAYFRDCNPECIPKTPLMKMPTIFNIDKEKSLNKFNQIKSIVEAYMPEELYKVTENTQNGNMHDSYDKIHRKNLDYANPSKSYQHINYSHNK